jgi:hypothetical protein
VPFEHICAPRRGGEVSEAVGKDHWVQQRLAQHKTLHQDFLQGLADNRWVRVNECRMPDGGLSGCAST